MRPILGNVTVAVNGEHLVAEVGNDLIIMSVATNQYYGLGATGLFLWKYLEQGNEFEVLVARTVEHFQIDVATATRDVTAFIRDLESEGLVALVTPSCALEHRA